MPLWGRSLKKKLQNLTFVESGKEAHFRHQKLHLLHEVTLLAEGGTCRPNFDQVIVLADAATDARNFITRGKMLFQLLADRGQEKFRPNSELQELLFSFYQNSEVKWAEKDAIERKHSR